MTNTVREQLIATGHSFLEAYNRWNVQDIIAIRTPTCVHHTLPASLHVPPRSNAAYATFMEPMLTIFRGVRFWVIRDDEVTVDLETRTVVLHCADRADTDAGEYANEYMFSLTMSEDRTKVEKVIEFIDSAYTNEFKRRIALTRTSAGGIEEA